jgi:hypothetical protein
MIDTIILRAGSSDIRREMKCQCDGGVADVLCHVDVVVFARLCHDKSWFTSVLLVVGGESGLGGFNPQNPAKWGGGFLKLLKIKLPPPYVPEEPQVTQPTPD